MHHTLRFYGRHQHKFLRLYIALAKLINIPVVGVLVRSVANTWGKRGHHGYLLSLEQAEQIIDISKSVALGPCNCRRVFRNCDAPVMAEIVVGAGVETFSEIKPGELREISKEEAKGVLRTCHEARMMHTIMRCGRDFYAICNCCTCCCVPTRLRQHYGIEYALVRNRDVVEDFRRQQL